MNENGEKLKNTVTKITHKITESRRTTGGFGPPFPHQKSHEYKHKFLFLDLSSKNTKRKEKNYRKQKNENGRGEGDGGSLILFNRAIIHSQFCPWI